MSTRLICLVVTLVCPLALLAQDGKSGMLQVKGNVAVNGSQVRSSSVTYVGDRIETGDDSSANLTQKGSLISIASNSRVIYDSEVLRLERGEVIVGTQKQYRGRIKNLTVTPTEKKNKYRLILEHCEIRITALQGEVFVDDGKDTVLLREGKTIRRVNKEFLRVHEKEKDQEAEWEYQSFQQPPSKLMCSSPTDKDHSDNGECCPAILPAMVVPWGPVPGVAAAAASTVPAWVWAAGAAGAGAAATGVMLGTGASGGSHQPLTPSSPSQ
jgi:hypothetical protein